MTKTMIEEHIKQILLQVKSKQVLEQLKEVNKMIERTFDNFDDCIIVLEEGREEIVSVTKLLIENMKD